MSIVCTGSVAVDHIMVFQGRFREVILPDKIHMLNVAFHVPELKRSYGGTAANIAYNLRRLGEDPIVLAAVGADFGSYAEWLTSHGIALDHVLRLEGEATPGCYITTDLDDNQITAFHPGAMDRAHEARLDAVPGGYELGIVSPNGKQAMVDNARGFKQRGVPVLVDPGQALPLFERDELIELLDGADLYVVNDYEWSLTLEKTGLASDEIAGRVGAIIVTRGEKGSVLRRAGEHEEIAAVPAARVVDPTGCGDAYRAGLLWGRRRGLPLESCMRLGSVMGSLLVERAGTQSLELELDQIRERYQREFGAEL